MTEVAVVDEYSIANLSLYLGDSSSAREAARRISADPRALEYAEAQRRSFSAFSRSQDRTALSLAKATFKKLADVPNALKTACEALQ